MAYRPSSSIPTRGTAAAGGSTPPPSRPRAIEGSPSTTPAGLQRWLEINTHAQQAGAPVQAQRAPLTFARLATLQVPALVLAADCDLTTPPYIGRAQASHIPHARFMLIPETGHSINWE